MLMHFSAIKLKICFKNCIITKSITKILNFILSSFSKFLRELRLEQISRKILHYPLNTKNMPHADLIDLNIVFSKIMNNISKTLDNYGAVKEIKILQTSVTLTVVVHTC